MASKSKVYPTGTTLGGQGSGTTFQTEKEYRGNEGSLAKVLKPTLQAGLKNVVKDYPWTVSNTKNRDDIPYVRLIEYKCNESSIFRQAEFYTKLSSQITANASGAVTRGILGGSAEQTGVLEVYKEMFPKDNPTDFSYWFPYFNETGFELNTPNWKQLEPAGEALKSVAQGLENIIRPFSRIGASAVETLTKGGEFVSAAAETAMKSQYPVVNVFDRPRVFAGHTERTTTISFPLYNTINEWDWVKNRDLIYILMSQNLFNKRDIIAGVPPVFYDVFIPGQYYCYAACMTDINVKNLGNTRLIDGEYIIPDAYQVTLTLTEMVQPSKNQFEAVTNGSARQFVNSQTIQAGREAEEARQRVRQEQEQEIIERNRPIVNQYAGYPAGVTVLPRPSLVQVPNSALD